VGLDDDRLPSFVLAVESEELGITAGLQDRVVQAYGGCVHMDFAAELLRGRGHGAYSRVPLAALPPLFLAYAADPSDSGRIHAPVKQRWLAGDAEVVDGMASIAALADEGLRLCTERPYAGASSPAEREAIAHAWAALFARNFDARRRLFGEFPVIARAIRRPPASYVSAVPPCVRRLYALPALPTVLCCP